MRRTCSIDTWTGPLATIDVSEGSWAGQLQSSPLGISYKNWKVGVVTSRSGGSARIGFADGTEAPLTGLPDKLKAGDYADAAQLFTSFLQLYPSGVYAPNALYWLGESYYVTQNYELALEAFQTLLSQHAGSRKEADALLKVGYCELALNRRAAGEDTLREVSVRYPGSEAAAKAESRLRTLALENR